MTTSEVPLSTARGVSTRVTWMSFANRSWPTPTVNTGIDRAFRLAIDSSSAASDVSAPSLIMTSPPAAGRQLVARAIERRRARRRPLVLEVAGRLQAIRGRGEPEEAEDELLREGVQQRAIGAEVVVDERAARAPVDVGNLQASRIVHQDAQEVLLRHGGLQDQLGAEQAEHDHAEDRQAEDDEDDAVATAALRDAAIAEQRVRPGQTGEDNRHHHRPRGTQDEIALLEEQRRVFEEEAKQ